MNITRQDNLVGWISCTTAEFDGLNFVNIDSLADKTLLSTNCAIGCISCHPRSIIFSTLKQSQLI